MIIGQNQRVGKAVSVPGWDATTPEMGSSGFSKILKLVGQTRKWTLWQGQRPKEHFPMTSSLSQGPYTRKEPE